MAWYFLKFYLISVPSAYPVTLSEGSFFSSISCENMFLLTLSRWSTNVTFIVRFSFPSGWVYHCLVCYYRALCILTIEHLHLSLLLAHKVTWPLLSQWLLRLKFPGHIFFLHLATFPHARCSCVYVFVVLFD